MGRRRRWKSKGLPAPGPATHDADPVTRSIAISGDRIVIASGRRWRVVDIKSRSALHTDTSHERSIRGIQFSSDGQYLLTCADDKTARSWSANNWSCLRLLEAAKKATACAFSSDGKYMFFSDRFGDVLTATTLPPTAAAAAAAAGVGGDASAAAGADAGPSAEAASADTSAAEAEAAAAAAAAAGADVNTSSAAAEAAADLSTPAVAAALGENPTAAAADGPTAAAASDEPSLLLGHLQAIISSLSTCNSSSGQQLLISTDRDGKVRASALPKDPTKGSYEIQSYCLGHTNFVTCAAAVPRAAAHDPQQQQQQQQLIVSGGGDGTVRLWDVDTGKQLAVYIASKQPPPAPIQQQQQQQQNGNEQQQENSNEQQQQEQENGEQQQQQQQENDGSSSSSSSDDDEDECDGGGMAEAAVTDGATIDGQAIEGPNKPSRPPIQRQQYAAVLNLAVSPDGKTLAAAVEGQQEIQILKITQDNMLQRGSSYTLDLQQKLRFSDVCNPAAVAFDDQRRLWVVGGVLKLESESAHVAVAEQCEPGAEFIDITSKVLLDDLRSYLECRVDQEESDLASRQQIGYYHEGFKRKIYQRGEDDPKKPRAHLRETERLKAMREAEDRKRQQQQQQQQQQSPRQSQQTDQHVQ